MRARLPLAGLVALGLGGGALAQAPIPPAPKPSAKPAPKSASTPTAKPDAPDGLDPEILKSFLGEWLVATADGKPGCRVRLEAGRTIGGRVALPAPDCAQRNPRVADATAWQADGGVVLRDAQRKVVATFAEDETTLMKTPPEVNPTAMLVRAKPGVERAPYAPDLFGAWVMRRPAGPVLCEVALADKPPRGGEDSFALTTGSTCDPAVRRLKLASWRVEDFALVLYGEGDASLRFEPAADGFDKAEGGRPLRLVRAGR